MSTTLSLPSCVTHNEAFHAIHPETLALNVCTHTLVHTYLHQQTLNLFLNVTEIPCFKKKKKRASAVNHDILSTE